MDKNDIKFLEELLHNTEKDSAISQISNIANPLILHVYAANYNWNSGFDIPKAILENENCDFGTGLLMFHCADGYRMLENPDDVKTSTLEEWKDFLVQIYNRLINLQFKSQNISFDPELTKVQKFKLKKNNPNIPDILLDKSPGSMFDIMHFKKP
ncbi:DUF4274 domain-containing protein [Bacillus swezeyi]|uniref:DUF4274 domain-containing protein n=1 Tax=Bacillus swezeyi TaxID=1925020 RepID=A0A1R1Q9L1_9BACI|nr:DUF4274 domain-containing protein [Bacillus swezeyi]MEC1260010.1 DUF4274 domain-containing protein [Bacillus swezeyi]MED2929758.1 DUF4274 domain-containing protein [Bacillus swezeyi]MED2963215.1 DUF4274 domain-containing protein [Bacillus swezeyi]MED3073166.1 DUF4274 domain-containing protein [Bacillus swezeyi]MED3082755.1 DUF4274 domain-containing protein [Bacillus swezeyi]